MQLTKLKKSLENETAVSEFVPFTHLASPEMFETKDHMFGLVLSVEGLSSITATDDELNQYQQMFHQALLKLDAEFMMYETWHRQKQSITLDGQFGSDFAATVNDKYQQRFKHASLFKNKLYLTLVYRNENLNHSKTGIVERAFSFGKRLSDSSVKAHRIENRAKSLELLMQKSQEIQSLLSAFGVRILSDNELLSFLSLVPNGGIEQHFPATAKSLIDTDKLPKQNLAKYLCNHRLFFGDVIQIQGNSDIDSRFAAMMSLKQYASQSASVMLDPLLNLNAEFILTQSYAPLERDSAIKAIERAYAMKVNAEDLSASQIEELGVLADFVASSKLGCGLHHASLMLLSDSKTSLNSQMHEATRAFSQANMNIIKETLAQIPAFFAQIPGNAHAIARSSIITSENFADFCALHNVKSGHHKANFLNSAVSLLESPSKTPVYFNYHVQGSKTNPSRGHALIIGGNDSGKTTLVSFLDAQMSRFKGQRSIFLDRNNGLKIYILAMNGHYLTICPKHKAQCQMNPLQLKDTPANRDFCKSWLQALLLREGESQLSGEITDICNDAIDYCFDSLEIKSRSLSELVRFLPVNFERFFELKRWLKGSDERGAGQFGWLFDNESDVIHLDNNRIGFDITYILDNLSPEVATSVFMYIMHRIELSLDGRLTSIVIDEMWQVLRTPYWRQWLEQRLPSIRKDYGHIIGMTQSPKTIVQSPISAELLDNVASLILFPNPKADASIYKDCLGLNSTEFEFIKNNSPQSRLFLYKHDTDSMICRLDLSDLSDEVRVFSGNKSSVALMERLIAEKGQSPDNWLKDFYAEGRK